MTSSSITLYGRLSSITAYNYSNVYDATEHAVTVGASETLGVSPTVSYTGTGDSVSSLSITYCDDSNNGVEFTYVATFQKTYSDGTNTWTGSAFEISGTFTLSLSQRTLVVVVAKSLIVNDATEMGDSYKSCTVIGAAADASTLTLYDTVTPSGYVLSEGYGCTVTVVEGGYEISGKGYINSSIPSVAIVDASDGSADRSSNYDVHLYGGQIVILNSGSAIIEF